MTRQISFRFHSPSVILLLLAALLFVVVSCAPDLSSPEATVLGYCNSEGEAVQQYFPYPVESLVRLKRPWSECRIFSVSPAAYVGRRFNSGIGWTVVKSDDMDVVTEVKLIYPRPGAPKTKYYYLVRKINGEWKIISYHHIPDENYPAYD